MPKDNLKTIELAKLQQVEFSDLPDEVLELIAEQLTDFKTRSRLSRSCKRFYFLLQPQLETIRLVEQKLREEQEARLQREHKLEFLNHLEHYAGLFQRPAHPLCTLL